MLMPPKPIVYLLVFGQLATYLAVCPHHMSLKFVNWVFFEMHKIGNIGIKGLRMGIVKINSTSSRDGTEDHCHCSTTFFYLS